MGSEEIKTGVFQIAISGLELGCRCYIGDGKGYGIRIKVEKAIKYTTARQVDKND